MPQPSDRGHFGEGILRECQIHYDLGQVYFDRIDAENAVFFLKSWVDQLERIENPRYLGELMDAALAEAELIAGAPAFSSLSRGPMPPAPLALLLAKRFQERFQI